MEGTEGREDRSLAETPTWAFATVVAVMVAFGFFFHFSLKHFKKWLEKTKRKSLLAALEKMKDELMLFGLLSLLMGHWTLFVAKICVKTSVLSSRFYPCVLESDIKPLEHIIVSDSNYFNDSAFPDELTTRHNYCPKIQEQLIEWKLVAPRVVLLKIFTPNKTGFSILLGQESFASYESLEQLHRLLFVLGVIHVSYSFVTIALAMIKIYSWRRWEDQAKSMAIQGLQALFQPPVLEFYKSSRLHGFALGLHNCKHMDFICHMTSITICSEAWRKNFGISLALGATSLLYFGVPLWIYAISCIFLNFHGPLSECLNDSWKLNSSMSFTWVKELEFTAIFAIAPIHSDTIMGCVRKIYIDTSLAVELTSRVWTVLIHNQEPMLLLAFLPSSNFEIMDTSPQLGNHQVKLRDELFWFGRPKLLLWLIQLISFQNAFEMSTFIWSLWEIRGPSCFMENRNFAVIRLIFGVVSQFWCSFITFPLYVIITQMGSRFKKTIMSENVRKSLHGWQRRVKARHSGAPFPLLTATSTSSLSSLCPLEDEMDRTDHGASSSKEGSYSILEDTSTPYQPVSLAQSPSFEVSPSNKSPVPLHCDPIHDSYHSDEEEDQK
ncbi:MLO-like protein 4 [Vitis vinifera]|uniref:MLO-like protein n=2 Tax=Vitis vinifera TaxID=29760 RepID=A0A438K6B3_VITVI|nr:MLO-like protein 4 [Vitis vinifera]